MMRRLSEIPCQMLARIVDLHVRAVRYSGKKSHAVCSFFGVFLCGFRTPLTSPSFCNFLVRYSVYIFLPFSLSCGNLKLHQTLEAKSIFKQEKSMLQLIFNPGLALTGFRTTRPRCTAEMIVRLVYVSMITCFKTWFRFGQMELHVDHD